MEKRTVGNLGVESSLLGYGCMRFPQNEDGTIDEKKAEQLLDRAIAEGVTYIDTAYPYHNECSEPFVGKVLKKYPRDSFLLATKLPMWNVEKEDDVEVIFSEQLKRLQTDHVDFYLLHAINQERWEKAKKLHIVDTCKRLQEEGKIRFLGFSFHDKYEVFEEILNYRDWDFCQMQLNYMDTEEQAGLKGYDFAYKKGIPIVVMEPVKGGALASFAKDVEDRFHEMDPNSSIASFAFRWVGSLPGVKVILSGMTTMEQLEDNLKTFHQFRPLSQEEQETIQEIVRIINSRVQNGCTGCGYCMPCPAGVDIPQNFRLWNTYHMYGNYGRIKNSWEKMRKEEKQAKQCVKCGNCEMQCPQKLSISTDLERVQKDLDEAEIYHK